MSHFRVFSNVVKEVGGGRARKRGVGGVRGVRGVRSVKRTKFMWEHDETLRFGGGGGRA